MKFRILVLILLATAALADQVVYVRNQPVYLRERQGVPAMPLSSVRHLLTREQNQRLVEDDGTLTVKDTDGESKTFPLEMGTVADWEEMLLWLGYSRRINPETGTIDFYTDGTRKKEDGKGNQWESEELAIARSMRRPGYRAARKNYLKVIDAVPKGGTAQDRDRVKRLGRRIVAECPLSDLHWTFEVIATPIPNALCTGEGFVMVTTGLLDLNLSDDELAGVLGHEVAHGVRRHTLLYEERFDELMALNKQMQSLESQLGQAEAEGDAHSAHRIKARGRALLPRIQFLVDFLKNKQSYDLHEEEEADVLGITYAAAAGFDPDGEARALTKLQRRSVELFGQSINKSSRTHPPLKRRLEILRLVQSRWRS